MEGGSEEMRKVVTKRTDVPIEEGTMRQFRQGDVLIETVKEIPAKANKLQLPKRIVLAEGEATGHAHVLSAPEVQLFERNGVLFAMIGNAGGVVCHEEHAPVTLEKGAYRIRRQREYSPEAIRNVAD
jgi:hypothetical protein